MRRRAQWLKHYFSGPQAEIQQFEFILGQWNTTLTAYDLDGKILQEFSGHWKAKHLDGGRIVMDEYESILPNGQVLHGGTTLRTFSPETNQWEMVFLNSMQPNLTNKFIARFHKGEILGDAFGRDLDGIEVHVKVRFYNIASHGFDWEQNGSWDGGETWYRLMRINAVRASVP